MFFETKCEKCQKGLKAVNNTHNYDDTELDMLDNLVKFAQSKTQEDASRHFSETYNILYKINKVSKFIDTLELWKIIGCPNHARSASHELGLKINRLVPLIKNTPYIPMHDIYLAFFDIKCSDDNCMYENINKSDSNQIVA